MKPKNKKFSPEARAALLQGCVTSGLSIREYAALKNVGYSTLNKWASQTGISLAKKQNIREVPAKTTLTDPNETPRTSTDSDNRSKEGFSFINLTNRIKDATPGPSFFHHKILKRDAFSCGLEIRLPNGIMLKIDQVPFDTLCPQVVEIVRALA